MMKLRLSSPLAVLTAMLLLAAAPAGAKDLQSCRLRGVENEAWCGRIERPLDPAQPDGKRITIRYAVLPALARNKRPDPVFFFAGGPGQSAIELAGPLSKRFARFANRRDRVFVDQRGTGDSAPLKCADDAERQPPQPLVELLDETRQVQRLRECREQLQKLPHGDLRMYTTTIAMADIDAVRQAIGAERIDAIGASYGTRAVLEYQRLYPQRVRRAVLDGVAPPDMVLPASFSQDNQAALDALLAACEQEAACRVLFPELRRQWQGLLESLPREVSVPHPMTGRVETLLLSRSMLLAAVRGPLYMPTLAAALPAAIDAAARGRFDALIGLASALGGSGMLASGMHFSVVCAEDYPLLGSAPAAGGRDFGASFSELYARVCADWPHGTPPRDFYRIAAAPVATLVLSGGADPVTPSRHGERVAKALGPKARHVVVANAGHGVLALGCVRDAVVRFVDAATDDEAAKVDVGCADKVPRPPAFVPVGVKPASIAVGGAK